MNLQRKFPTHQTRYPLNNIKFSVSGLSSFSVYSPLHDDARGASEAPGGEGLVPESVVQCRQTPRYIYLLNFV